MKQDSLADMVGHIMNFDIKPMTDGQLLGLQRSYQHCINIRLVGEVIVNMPAPYGSYPAVVFEECLAVVDAEIKRRVAEKGEVKA